MFVVRMCLHVCVFAVSQYSVFISRYLIGSSFTLHLFVFSAFLRERARVCVAICVCSVPACVSVSRPSIGHAVGRRHSLWILLLVVLLRRQRAVRATQTTSYHPSSIISRAALSLLSLFSFSWAPESRLWPVDECYILAVSTGVSWGLACGGSAVSCPVCQLLVSLPPAPLRRLQSVAQT